MREQSFFTWMLPLLLIGLGFVLLGHYTSDDVFPQPEGKTDREERPDRSAGWAAAGSYPSAVMVEKTKFNITPQADEDLPFPDCIGDLYLDKVISGEEALKYARHIHGEDAPLERVSIPYYSGKQEQVSVWVLEMLSVNAARKHMENINARMARDQADEGYGSFFLQEVKVYYLPSCQGNSYYYRKDNKIYWISLRTGDPIPLFLRFYDYF